MRVKVRVLELPQFAAPAEKATNLHSGWDMSHQTMTLRRREGERTTPRRTVRIVCVHIGLLLLLASVLLAEQFAPAPPHEQRHSPPIPSAGDHLIVQRRTR